MSAGISVLRQARKDAAVASSKFSSSILRFSFVNSSFNVFRSFIVGGASCYNTNQRTPNGTKAQGAGLRKVQWHSIVLGI